MADQNPYEQFQPANSLTDHAHEARNRLSADFSKSSLDSVQARFCQTDQTAEVERLLGQGSDALTRAGYTGEVSDKPQVYVRAGESIQRAIDRAPAGSVINVAEGVYKERLDIKRDGITLKANGHAVLDMGGKPLNGGVINISGRKDVTIDGFEIRNVNGGSDPMAIRIEGTSSNIRIANNDIHDIKDKRNAHGIGVYGNSAQALKNVVIENNKVHDLKLGRSEAVAINGNVDGFKIIGNTVRDNNNIGIDIIGGEGVGKKGIDRARNGLIAHNKVHNIDSLKNYGTRSAAGIYIDGGSDVTVRNNVVTDSNYGIEVAAERGGWNATKVRVFDNRIERSHLAGISLGGGEAGNGGVTNSRVENNTLIGNKRGVWQQHHVKNVFVGDNPTR